MKTYTTKEELLKDANEQLKGYAIYHDCYGDGEIEEISGSTYLFVKLNFMGTVKLIAPTKAGNHITKDANATVLLDFAQAYEDLTHAEEKAKNDAWWAEYNAKREAEKKAAQEAKEKKAYETYVQTAEAKAKKLAMTASKLSVAEDEETWVKNHINVVSAQVPDFLDTWFRSKFPTADYNPVDSRRKTSGGFKMKWGLSLSATVKNPETAPAEVQTKLNGSKITDTEYLFGLCLNYGLKIGKRK